jgi:hypothetical protein
MNHLLALALCAAVAGGCAAPPQVPRAEPPESRVERQMIGLLEKFDRWDLNGDGRLTIDELDEASRISGMPASEILSFYDANSDGAITLVEAQAAYARSPEAERRARRFRRS